MQKINLKIISLFLLGIIISAMLGVQTVSAVKSQQTKKTGIHAYPEAILKEGRVVLITEPESTIIAYELNIPAKPEPQD